LERPVSNNGEYTAGVMVTPASSRGWRDYMADLARAGGDRAAIVAVYPADFDAWDQREQRHYERGRLRAAGAHLRYRRIPTHEPADVVQRLNGLGLVPRRADRPRTWRRRNR
jgi:hypothetical protein